MPGVFPAMAGLRTYLALVHFVLLGCLGPGPVQAADQDIQSFLQQVQEAARTLDYSGVYIYQQGASLQTQFLAHMVDGTGERSRIEALDGPVRECLRHDGVEECLYPDHSLVSVRKARKDHFPGLLLGDGELLARHYSWIRPGKPARIAGRECIWSELRARDTLRYSYRLCTDTDNSLLLRVQTIDAGGALVEQASFGSLALGADAAPEGLHSPWDTSQWRTHAESVEPVDLSSEGWRFALPAGFMPIAEFSRDLGLQRKARQLVLSDGLAAISVFIETFDPESDQSIRQGGVQQGAVNIYRMRLASWWLTVVGTVPAQTVHDLAHAVQYLPQAAQ